LRPVGTRKPGFRNLSPLVSLNVLTEPSAIKTLALPLLPPCTAKRSRMSWRNKPLPAGPVGLTTGLPCSSAARLGPNWLPFDAKVILKPAELKYPGPSLKDSHNREPAGTKTCLFRLLAAAAEAEIS